MGCQLEFENRAALGELAGLCEPDRGLAPEAAALVDQPGGTLLELDARPSPFLGRAFALENVGEVAAEAQLQP